MFNMSMPKPIGEFTVAKRRVTEASPVCIARFNNLITDYGLDMLYGGTGTVTMISSSGGCPLRYCAVGDGTVEIEKNFTALSSQVGSRQGLNDDATRNYIAQIVEVEGVKYAKFENTWAFPLGSYVGTFTEVGLFNSSTGNNMFSGTLIKNEFGEPQGITVTAEEQLFIRYTLHVPVPSASALGAFDGSTIYGDPYPITLDVKGTPVSGLLHIPFGYYLRDYAGGTLNIYKPYTSQTLTTTTGVVIYTNPALTQTHNHNARIKVETVKTPISSGFENTVRITIAPSAGDFTMYGILCNKHYSTNTYSNLVTFDDPIHKSASESLMLEYYYSVTWE